MQYINKGITTHGEDILLKPKSSKLLGLIQYNDYRSWPSTKTTDSGEIDKQNLLLYLNIKYLSDNGFANSDGFLNFDPGADRFIIKGITYKALGESQTAQASEEPLLQFIILKREEIDTVEDQYL